MGWYLEKIASLINNVQVSAYSGEHLVLLVNGKRYEYRGVPGSYWNGEIDRWKKWKNKRAAGEKVSALIRNLASYLQQPQEKPQVEPKKFNESLFEENDNGLV